MELKTQEELKALKAHGAARRSLVDLLGLKGK